MSPPTPALYDAPLDTPSQVAWIVLAAAALVLATRAVRVEVRSTRGARPDARTATVRGLDVALDVAAVAAVLGLLGSLAAVVLAVFG